MTSLFQSSSKKPEENLGKSQVHEGFSETQRSGDQFMQAITWDGKQKVSMSSVGMPLLTHPQDVIVKVTSCSISGSDSHLFSGEVSGLDRGFVLGHEAMGIIHQKGSQVTNFNLGDRVVIASQLACGDCDFCKRNEFSGCDAACRSKLDKKSQEECHTALAGHVDGGQAEYIRVPIADVNCFKVPDNVPDKKALFLSEALCTALHACDLGEVGENDTVVIWGLGPIGLYTARWAQIKGAKRIIGIDSVAERLALAHNAFKIEVLDRSELSSDQVVERLQELLPNGPDVVIEASGFKAPVSMTGKIQRAVGLVSSKSDTLTELLNVVRKFGRVAIIADYGSVTDHFPIGHLMMKHLTVRSGHTPVQAYFPMVMDAVQSGQIDPTPMISHVIALKDAPLAYEKFASQTEGYIKVFIDLTNGPNGPINTQML
jgi:threonine dehydrogenase-like Zn-dependent dehydrogenase